DIRAKAAQIAVDNSVSKISDYKIDIYYQKNKPEEETIAKRIESVIKSRNLNNHIVLTPQDDVFFESRKQTIGLLPGNEVRFEAGVDYEAGQALAALINADDPTLNFRTRPYVKHITRALSIFMWVASK